MARPKTVQKDVTKTVTEEKKVEAVKEPVYEGRQKIKMLKTYLGPAGIFYINGIYELEANIAAMFISNGDAKKC